MKLREGSFSALLCTCNVVVGAAIPPEPLRGGVVRGGDCAPQQAHRGQRAPLDRRQAGEGDAL